MKKADNEYALSETYLQLRELAVEFYSEERLDDPKREMYGVVMDIGMEKGIVTLASCYTGDASLYFSNGECMLGAGKYENVVNVAKKYVENAGGYVKYAKKVNVFECPPAKKGDVCFYITSKGGIYLAKEKEGKIAKGESKLSPLFKQANKLIKEIRKTVK